MMKVLVLAMLAIGFIGVPCSMAQSSLPGIDSSQLENVKLYGAKGDGTTDDTQAIQSAIDASVSRGTKIVLFPPGTYRTSGNGLKVLNAGVALVGLCEPTCILKHTGTGPAITVGDGTTPCLSNKISNLKILSSGAQSDGIVLNNYVKRYDIEHVTVTGFSAGTGIKAVDINHSGHLTRVQVEKNAIGISIGPRGYYTDISFSKITQNTKYGIEINEAQVVNVISTQVEKNGDLTGASVIARGVEALNLIGCYNEQNSAKPGVFLILTKGTVAPYCVNVNVIGCRSIGNHMATNCIILEGVHKANFTGNRIQSFTGSIFTVQPASAGAVQYIYNNANSLDGTLGNVTFE
jgi:hypothetical protein